VCGRCGGGSEADEVGRSIISGGLDDDGERGGVLAGVLAEVADDVLRRVGVRDLNLLPGLAPLVSRVRAPVIAPVCVDLFFLRQYERMCVHMH
jgi:hypothetical protein